MILQANRDSMLWDTNNRQRNEYIDPDYTAQMNFDTADQWLEGEGLQSIREHVSLEHNDDAHHYEYVPGLSYTAK